MSVTLRTPLCDQLGIDYPILSVGFSFSAGPELVAAVSGAGGFGVLGGSGFPPEHVRSRAARVKELTDRPFGLNLIVADFEDPEAPLEDLDSIRELATVAIESGVAMLVLFWGPAGEFVEIAHAGGAKVAIQVGSVAEAKAAAAAGVDAVIAQGIEAGGHVRGTESIWDLLPATVEAVSPLPVLASGGIGNGAGIARALRLGAQGVSLGTRFVATDEAWVLEAHKRRIVEARAEDTFLGDLFDVGWPGAPHRVIRNKLFEEWDAAGRPPIGSRPGEGTFIGTRRRPWGDAEWPLYAVGMAPPDFEGDPEYMPLWAGESCGAVNGIKPAAEIVRDLVRDAEAALAATPGQGAR